MNCVEPAMALAGAMGAVVARVGAANEDGAATEKLTELDTAEPVETVIAAVPAAIVSVYGTTAVSCVALTKAVVLVSGEPFQFTTEPFTKFVPVTCRVTFDGLHPGVEVAVEPETVTELTVGVCACVIANGTCADVPPPGAGVKI